MKIVREIKEESDYPRCPTCGILLTKEETTFSDEQTKQIEIENNCKHEPEESWLKWLNPCKKCGFSVFVVRVPSAFRMRCIKCGKLFHVESE